MNPQVGPPDGLCVELVCPTSSRAVLKRGLLNEEFMVKLFNWLLILQLLLTGDDPLNRTNLNMHIDFLLNKRRFSSTFNFLLGGKNRLSMGRHRHKETKVDRELPAQVA